jgi:proteasome lid subunit RPN8/RPN11
MAAEPPGGGHPTGGRPRLILPAAVLEAIRTHAAAVFPEECCGILVGQSAGATAQPPEPPGTEPSPATRVHRAVAAANTRRDRPHDRSAIPPETLLATHKTARAEGLEMVGYYHSHPGAAAVPSRFDRDHAWPHTSYLILPVTAEGSAEPRSWRLTTAESEQEEQEGWVEELVEVLPR